MFQTLLNDTVEIDEYISTSIFNIDKIFTAYDFATDMCAKQSMPINVSTLNCMDTFNDVQMEMGNPLVITESIMNGDLSIDTVTMEDGKQNILMRGLAAAKKFIENLFSKFFGILKGFFSFKEKFRSDLDKLKKGFDDINELDLEKLKNSKKKYPPKKLYEEFSKSIENEDLNKSDIDEQMKTIATLTDKKKLTAAHDAMSYCRKKTKETIKKFQKNVSQSKLSLHAAGFTSKAMTVDVLKELDAGMKNFEVGEQIANYYKEVEKKAKSVVEDAEKNMSDAEKGRMARMRVSAIKSYIGYLVYANSVSIKQCIFTMKLGINTCKAALACAEKVD